MSETIEIRLKM